MRADELPFILCAAQKLLIVGKTPSPINEYLQSAKENYNKLATNCREKMEII